MTTVVSNPPLLAALRPDLEFSSSGNKQADADTQRQAWLRQAEQDQMSLLQAAGNLVNAASGAAPQGIIASPDQAGVHTAALMQVHTIIDSGRKEILGGSASDNASPTWAPANGIGNSIGPTEVRSEPDASSVVTTLLTGPAQAASTQPGPGSNEPGTTLPDASANAPVQAAQTPGSANVTRAAGQIEPSEIAPDASQPAAVAAALPSAIAAAPAGGLVTPAIAAESTVAPAAQIGVSPTARAVNLTETAQAVPAATTAEDEEHGATEATPRSTNRGQSAADAWQKRNMHVAQNGRDVSISIRDAALDERQSAMVVARLASDAAQAGMRLREATVNGKTFAKASKEERTVSEESGENLPSAAALFSSYDTQEQ